MLVAAAAPTEPQVTNVTPASTARVAIGDDERVPVGVLIEPAPCLVIECDDELVHHEIMALGRAWGRPRRATLHQSKDFPGRGHAVAEARVAFESLSTLG